MKKIYLFTLLLSVFALNMTAQQTVEPLVKATYAQTTPYNDACPNGYAAGCGPVALAQILNYYKQPLHGYGSVTYTCSSSGVEISKDFSETTFDWDNILDTYTAGSYTSEQAEAVSELVYACGAAVYADYNTSTGTNNYAKMIYGMQHYLHFSPKCRYLKRMFYSTAEWIEMLNSELRSGHPVFYRGDWRFNGGKVGHMFVIDGLNADSLYHVNFGHGGSGNKYVDINVINQSGNYAGGRPVCYNASQAMVVNCYPTPDESYVEQACILDEPLTLNSDETISQVVVGAGESFNIGCVLRNCAGQSAKVYYHWVLEQDGKTIEEYKQGSYGLSAGYKFSSAKQTEILIPEGLADGTYQLKLYTKSDLQTDWQEVWANAPTNVEVQVANGSSTITIPNSHKGNPCLYLRESIKEVETEFANSVPGRSFLLALTNNTGNNFEDVIRLEVVVDGVTYTYDATIPVYSQTKTDFHISIPQSSVDLSGKTITSIKASYLYDGQYYELGTVEPTQIAQFAQDKASDIYIYTLQGTLVKRLSSSDVSSAYQQVLEQLPHGTYIIKEGAKSRKFLKH